MVTFIHVLCFIRRDYFGVSLITRGKSHELREECLIGTVFSCTHRHSTLRSYLPQLEEPSGGCPLPVDSHPEGCNRMPAKRLAPPGELRVPPKPLVCQEVAPVPLLRPGW